MRELRAFPFKMMRRRAWLWLLLVCVAGLLGACRAPVPEWLPSLQDLPAPRGWWAQEETTAVVPDLLLVAPQGEEIADAHLQQAVDAFNGGQSATQATLELTPDYADRLSTIVAGEEAADLLHVTSFELPDLARSGALIPYSDLLPAAELAGLTQDFYPALVETFTVDGELYCLPQKFNTLALIYNPTRLNAAEQAHPTAAWTWDDLTAAAQAVTDMPTLFFTTYGLVLNADFSRWLPFLYQAGGRVLNGDATAMAINSETALESLNFYLGLILDGLAIRPAELSSSWNGEAFGKGRTALTVEGNWIVPYLEQEFPTLQFGVAPLPAGPAGRATLLFSDCYAIAANSAQPQHALALALHLLSPETLHTRMDDQAAAPARISLRETWLAGQPIMEPFLSGVEYARPWQLGAGMQPLVDAVNSGMVQVLNGDIPPEEVLRVAEVIGSDILDD